MMTIRPEILAPVGSPECVVPAVRSGADAVYLGAKLFSARGNAGNFSRDELAEAVKYCHARGTAVHLACNTLLRDDEIPAALELVKYACDIHADAIIVQDIGLASLIKRAAPDMPLHASTQMSAHTPDAVKMLYDMGFKRVVLSRELSKKEIIEIADTLSRDNCPIELEVFVHGALCMCVSGQCYMSAMLGSRSGNRGLCAQPCRLPFYAGGNGHDLSLKDLSIISDLHELKAIGVTSFKIEGRMKRPEYVAAAVAACRQSLDRGYVDDDILEKLRAVFSRSGFTDGYYTGRLGAEMFGIRSKEDVTSVSGKLLSQIRALYKDERQNIPVSFSLEIKTGQKSRLAVSDNDGNICEVEGDIPEAAVKVPLSAERCGLYLKKTGGTPFFADDDNIKCNIDDGLSLSAQSLNALRRSALGALLETRGRAEPVAFILPEISKPSKHIVKNKTGMRARFRNGDIPDAFLECELVYVPMFLPDNKIKALLDRGFAVAAEIPRAMFGREREIEKRLRELKNIGVYDVLASNIGAVATARRLGMDIHGGFGLNLSNTPSLEWAYEIGMIDAEVSFELTLRQIEALGGDMPRGAVSYGRLPLMLTRNCPYQSDGRGCRNCKVPPIIRDRRGKGFPIVCDRRSCEILNCVPLILSDRQKEIKNVDYQVMSFTVENGDESRDMLCAYIGNAPAGGEFTRGLYYRGVE